MKDENQSFEELLSQAREVGEDEDLYWNIIWLLAERSDRETFGKAVALTRAESFERSFAAAVLGRFGARIHTPERPFSSEIVNLLLEMLAMEKDEKVISSLVSALGHQVEDARIPLALKGLASHQNEGLRWNLALTLAHYETPESIEMLIVLTRDNSVSVRDWATFGLGTQCDLDTPEIRAALIERLRDVDEETRAEAIFGLAKRKDKGAIEAIERQLESGFSGALLFEAILAMPDAILLPILRDIAQNPNFPEDDEDIRAAIAVCEAHCEPK